MTGAGGRPTGPKLAALAPVLLLAVLLVSWNGTAWSGAVASGAVSLVAAERSDVEWRESQQVSGPASGKCRDFHGALARPSERGFSDGRVKGATLAGLLSVLAHGRRAPCPLVLEARAVCAVSTGGSMGFGAVFLERGARGCEAASAARLKANRAERADVSRRARKIGGGGA